MLERLRSLIGGKNRAADGAPAGAQAQASGPDEIFIDAASPFKIAGHLTVHYGFPILDWKAVWSWIDTLTTDLQAGAWVACERAWLLHFRKALGPKFRLVESDSAAVLSSLEGNVAKATLDYIDRTRARVVRVLEGIAEVAGWGKDLLIVFDDQDSYYHYVSYYYPEKGEFAFSGGMHISAGCSHFVTVKADLRSIEPTIAHEMTHGCVAHLPLPVWLNEGLAVNTEHRLAGAGTSLHTPQEMREKHLAFWGEDEIQEFWSGKSFERTDEGNLLSYDLARIMVEQLAKDWEPFKRFVLAADREDGGARAGAEAFGIDLGEYACALLEKDPSPAWTPRPQSRKDEQPPPPGR
jgi:hypothetical protein